MSLENSFSSNSDRTIRFCVCFGFWLPGGGLGLADWDASDWKYIYLVNLKSGLQMSSITIG